MTFQAQCRAFLARHELSHSPQIHTLDLASEVGEIAKAILEGSRYGESPLQSTPALAAELGDAFSLRAPNRTPVGGSSSR